MGSRTRFLPATKAMPKEMLPVVDKPAIQYVVEEAVAAGIDDILLDYPRPQQECLSLTTSTASPEFEHTLEAQGDHGKLARVIEPSSLADRLPPPWRT